MKIGYCGSPEDVLRFANDPFDFIEINLSELKDKTDEDIERYKDNTAKAGIPIESGCCFFPGDVRLCGSNYSAEFLKEYCHNILSKAQKLGVKIAVIGSGRARNIDDGEDANLCWQQLEESFSLIADIAAEYGVAIVVEPLNSEDTNVINNLTQGGDFVRKLSHPNLFLLADLFHITREGESYQGITDNADILRHVHVAEGINRHFPCEGDGFNYDEFVACLKKINYTGKISIEAVPTDDYDKEIKSSIRFLHSIFE
ncbi:MAG: sugar phosphate isomerase/epimerase [Eubacteriales bacterium]|nr:sugar phosphate isomerase/epimerase [Eubacteriales bacterium]